MKSLYDLHAVIAFFEERRGRLHGFRWRDPTDCKSCPPQATPTALDQAIGTGDGNAVAFQLAKRYGSAFNPWTRAIKKPVLDQRLRRLEEHADEPSTRELAAKLRQTIRG